MIHYPLHCEKTEIDLFALCICMVDESTIKLSRCLNRNFFGNVSVIVSEIPP